jgi:hypothetical protein
VNSSGISHDLSTSAAEFSKLFISKLKQFSVLQTMFGEAQVVEITVENRLFHRRWHGLSTTTIDI